MKKNELRIFTKENNSSVPTGVVIIKNKYGWTYVAFVEGKSFVNSTQDMKDCPEEEDQKFIKKLVKAIKEQLKLVQ